MVGSLEALNPPRLLPIDRRPSIHGLTILFGLAIAGLALYAIYSLRNRVTRGTPASPLEEGNKAFDNNNFKLALTYYAAALKQTTEPVDQAKIYLRCSKAYSNLRQFNQAIECCKVVLRYNPDPLHRALFLCEIGSIYEKQENIPETLRHYQEVQPFHDDSDFIYLQVQIRIIQIHRKNRDFVAALKCCKKASSRTKNPELLSKISYLKSWTLLDQGSIEEAEKENRIALQKAPVENVDLRAQILILQADILNRKGEPQQALEVGKQALELSPRSDLKIEIYMGRALSHYKLNKFEDSRQNYSDALQLVRNDEVLAFILYNKATIHAKLNDINSAKLSLYGATSSRFKDQSFARDLLRFMLEPLVQKEMALTPADILEQRIQQKQIELDKLKKNQSLTHPF